MINTVLNKITSNINLSRQESFDVMIKLMDGQLTDAQIAGFLVSLKMKNETVEEISGFVQALRGKATTISGPEDVIDTCGTGGDGTGTFNISTASAIVASAAGVTVAKHGNRSVSSKCGSADVLGELGVRIDLSPEQAQKCLHKVGIAFLFAPLYHASMKYAAGPRRELGIRTVFNILGPMVNPANTKRQVIGAFNLETAEKMINVLQVTGSEHVLVVHSTDGLDEISLSAPTNVFELQNNKISQYQISPDDFELAKADINELEGNTLNDNAEIIKSILEGANGPKTDIVAFNAGAAIYVSGKTPSIGAGIKLAQNILETGQAKKKLAELVKFTQNQN